MRHVHVLVVLALAAVTLTAAHPGPSERGHEPVRTLVDHTGQPRAGGTVFLVTDSVVLGAVDELAARLGGRPFRAEGSVSLHTSEVPAVLAANAGATGDTVIVATAYNDWGIGRGTIDAWIDAVMARLGATRQVIWVRPGLWHETMVTWNQALTGALGRYPNLELADWPGRSAGHPEYFYADGIHLTPAGRTAMADLLMAHIGADAEPPPPRPKPVVKGDLGRVTSTDTGLRAKGWVLASTKTAPIEAKLMLNGRKLVQFVADLPRPDVAAAHGLGPDHGFDQFVPGVRDGTHKLCLRARAGPRRDWKLVECTTVVVAHSPVGRLGAATLADGRVSARGWAFDPDRPNVPVQIAVVADGRVVALRWADRPRADVAAAHDVGLRHGFRFTVAVPPGTARACLVALDRQNSPNTRLGCT